MSSEFSVDLEHLDRIVARLSALYGFITDNLDSLDERVGRLVGTDWEGVAAQAYREAHDQWSRGAREFADGIADISEVARTAHGRYTRAIDLNRRMLAGD